MGAAASVDIDQYGSPSTHQMIKMKEHLSSVPAGVDSYGKVTKIRLVRKRKFMEHPLILELLQDMKLVLENVQVGLKVNGTGLGGTEVFHTSVMGMKESSKALHELVERRDQLRTELESVLFWRSDDDTSEKNQLFELFDLETCPPFTFISHRWAPEGRALGLHNELIGVLAMSKQEYFWLDCSCALQDADSFANGDCLKIIWNIGQLLDKATDILTYYATDGLHAPVYDSDMDTNTASDGLCRLYELACGADSSKLNSSFLNENAMRSAKGGTRLWCCFEFCCGRHKVLSPTALVPCITPPDQSSEVQSVQSSYSSYHSKIYRHQALHDSMFISLDCYAASDVEPVTTIMYRAKKLPCMLTSKYPMCWSQQKERTVHGFLLPALTAQTDDERIAATDRFGLTHVTTVTDVVTNNGWYLDPPVNSFEF